MSINKAELFKANGYGAIAVNNSPANIFYIFCFTYTLQEDVKSDGNKLAYGESVFNVMYTSPGRQKSLFYVNPY